MAKQPGFMFYPGDWLKDPSLRCCSHAAKGVWMDLLCIMFECERRGVLATAGRPWSVSEAASAVGGNQDVTRVALHELIDKGTCSKSKRTGCLWSRRMVRDERIRRLRARVGFVGGSKTKAKGKAKGKQTTENENEYSSLSVVKRRPSCLNDVLEAGKKISVSAAECERFFNYHESRGWVVGKSPMRDWVAALRTWKSNQRKWEQEKSGEPPRKVFTPEQLRAMQEADA